ncbi:MAG: tetratricopeptide repeat protein [Hydrogenothermaceae bacterium]
MKRIKQSILTLTVLSSVTFGSVNDKISEGINYYKIGNYDKAISSFEEALKEDPSNSVALSNLGFIYYKTGNFNKAKEYLLKSLNYIKDRELKALTYYVLADIEKKNSDEEGYIENLKKAIVSNPKFNDAVKHFFEFSVSKGRYEDIAGLNIDISLLPENYQLIVAQSYIKTNTKTETAKKILENLKDSKDRDISLKASEILAELKQNRLGGKEEIVVKKKERVSTHTKHKITDVEKNIPKLSTNYKKEIINIDKPVSTTTVNLETESELLKAAKENPSPSVFNKLGILYLNQGRLEDAKNSFLNALKLDPFDKEALNNLGILYFSLKDYDKAIKYFNEAIKRDDKFVDAYYNLGNVYYQLGDIYKSISYYKQAIENYKKVVSLNPENKSAYYNMANAYFKMEDYKSAIENYKKADLKDKKVAYNLSLSYYNLALMEDHKESAIENLKNAIKFNPEFKEAYLLLGKILYETGNYNQAKDYLKKAYEMYIDREKSEVVYLLGLIYSYSGDKDTAIKYYKELRQLDSQLADKLFESIFN